MSLLPNTILFPSMPIGKLDATNKEGYVLIEQNWWLFFYNLSQNVLGNPGLGLSAIALTELAALEADAADADAIANRQGIANDLTVALAQDPTVTDSDLPSIARALLLAQDSLLPDPTPLAQPVQSISVGASPFTYTAPFTGQVAVTGGTVSAIAIIRQGTTVATGLTTGQVLLSRADQIKVTYSSLPTLTFIPL